MVTNVISVLYIAVLDVVLSRSAVHDYFKTKFDELVAVNYPREVVEFVNAGFYEDRITVVYSVEQDNCHDCYLEGLPTYDTQQCDKHLQEWLIPVRELDAFI